MQSVLNDWVQASCTLKMQTVLISAIRGCDGVPKEDPSKQMTRHLRSTVLKCAEGGGARFNVAEGLNVAVNAVIKDMDRYPMHWLLHTMHAYEIVGYKGPNDWYLDVYYRMVEGMHLLPESEEHLDIRLADQKFDENQLQRYRELITHGGAYYYELTPPPNFTASS